MSVSNKIRALLNLKDMKPQDLSTCLNISVQAVRNKFTRDSFSVSDLIKISSFLNCELLFEIDCSQSIELTMDDLKSIPVATLSELENQSKINSELQESHEVLQHPTPQKQIPHYKPFTEADAAKIDLRKLLSNMNYQLDIGSVFGMEVLGTLMEQARQQEEKNKTVIVG